MSLKLSRKEWEAAEGIQELRDNERYLNDQCLMLRAERDALQAQVEVLREALHWYAEHVAGCRKIGSVGEPFQQALARDGGQKARAALTPSSDAEMGEKT